MRKACYKKLQTMVARSNVKQEGRKRERDRETDRQTDRQTYRQRERAAYLKGAALCYASATHLRTNGVAHMNVTMLSC